MNTYGEVEPQVHTCLASATDTKVHVVNQTFIAVQLRYLVFWVVTRRGKVCRRRFGTAYRSQLQGSRCQRRSFAQVSAISCLVGLAGRQCAYAIRRQFLVLTAHKLHKRSSIPRTRYSSPKLYPDVILGGDCTRT